MREGGRGCWVPGERGESHLTCYLRLSYFYTVWCYVSIFSRDIVLNLH